VVEVLGGVGVIAIGRPVDADRTDHADHLDRGSRNGAQRADVTATTEEQTR